MPKTVVQPEHVCSFSADNILYTIGVCDIFSLFSGSRYRDCEPAAQKQKLEQLGTKTAS